MRMASLAVLVAFGVLGCDQVDTDAPLTDSSYNNTTGDTTTGDTTTGDTTTGDTTTPADTAVDNTAVNERDAGGDTKTPIDQDETQRDVNITAEIRQRILNTKDMSINARNAKIITAKGKVTLRGPVDSVSERDAIVQIARDVAGEGNVENDLDVPGETPSTTPPKDEPDAPESSDTPATPKSPETPESPEAPATPETPATPE